MSTQLASQQEAMTVYVYQHRCEELLPLTPTQEDVVSYNGLLQARQQQQQPQRARLQHVQPQVDHSVDMAPSMSRKRSSHSKFGPVPFSDTEERVPPLMLDWQADSNTPFTCLDARPLATPAFKKRRQSLQSPESPQAIKVYEPSAYCENQPTLSPTLPLNVRSRRTSSQHYVNSSPYPTPSTTSHSPATSMSDFFPTNTPSTSACMSREPSLYENMSMLRFKSQTSDDMNDSHTLNVQSTSNGSQSSDLSLFSQSFSLLHAGGMTDDASSSPVSNLATCYTSPSTVHDNTMTRSLSSESTDSSKSRSSRRSLQEVVQGQGARHIKPKENTPSMSRQFSSSSCAGADMARTRSEDGTKVGIPKNQTYVRPQHPKVFCDQCNIKPEGFRGPHELRRHVENKHTPTRTVWVCKDRSPDQKFLSKCKACNDGKEYGAYYNAAAHLRRIHFHAKEKGKKGKGNLKEKPRGGDGGGDDPPMEIIKLWIEASQVTKDGRYINVDEADDKGRANYVREDTPEEFYGNGYCQSNSMASTDATTLSQPPFTSPASNHAINGITFSPAYDTNTSSDMSPYVPSAPSMFTSLAPAAEFDVDTNAPVITPVNQDLPSNDIMNLDLYNQDFPGSMDHFDLTDPSLYTLT